jgi:hypothetical protein
MFSHLITVHCLRALGSFIRRVLRRFTVLLISNRSSLSSMLPVRLRFRIISYWYPGLFDCSINDLLAFLLWFNRVLSHGSAKFTPRKTFIRCIIFSNSFLTHLYTVLNS